MSMPSIIVVCTGNICRSPVGEAALSYLLPKGIEVTSAGTRAVMDARAKPEAQHFLQRELAIAKDHHARQMSRELAESSDLIITMTTEHRSWIARTAPRTVRRTFTLKELDLLLSGLPEKITFGSLKEVGMTASRLRPRLAQDGAKLDIADPYGGPSEGYESSFSEILNSSRRIAHAISQRLNG